MNVNYLLVKVVVYEHNLTTFTFVVASLLDVLKKMCTAFQHFRDSIEHLTLCCALFFCKLLDGMKQYSRLYLFVISAFKFVGLFHIFSFFTVFV